MVSDVDLTQYCEHCIFLSPYSLFDALHLVFYAVRVEQTVTGESSTVFQMVVPALYPQVFW
jgi:hypothetical protein